MFGMPWFLLFKACIQDSRHNLFLKVFKWTSILPLDCFKIYDPKFQLHSLLENVLKEL